MVINITIHDLVKNYSCRNVFNKKNINTFDVLTFIQMRTDEIKCRYTSVVLYLRLSGQFWAFFFFIIIIIFFDEKILNSQKLKSNQNQLGK